MERSWQVKFHRGRVTKDTANRLTWKVRLGRQGEKPWKKGVNGKYGKRKTRKSRPTVAGSRATTKKLLEGMRHLLASERRWKSIPRAVYTKRHPAWLTITELISSSDRANTSGIKRPGVVFVFPFGIPYEICIKRVPVTGDDRITRGNLQDRGLIKRGRLIKSSSLVYRPTRFPSIRCAPETFCNSLIISANEISNLFPSTINPRRNRRKRKSTKMDKSRFPSWRFVFSRANDFQPYPRQKQSSAVVEPAEIKIPGRINASRLQSES